MGGPLSFAEFQYLALYGENGFFGDNNRVGRSGDFVTSPTLGSVFARVLGNAFDVWWNDLDRPSPFDVIECGSADGTLAKAVLQLDLDCKKALRYTVVEYADELPKTPIIGVIFANELLDNLPVSLFEWDGSCWNEVCVDVDGSNDLSEVFRPVSPVVSRQLMQLVSSPEPFSRVPLQTRAVSWLAAAMNAVESGRVVCIDYMRATSEMASLPQAQWLRTYRSHYPGKHPFVDVGLQDITCDVALDQLLLAYPNAEVNSQTEFLACFGLEGIRADAERSWQTQVAAGGFDALWAQSVLGEISALVDGSGFGGFTVCQWPVTSRP